MKRIVTLVLTLLLVLSVTITASAAATLTASAPNPQPGTKITVTFGVKAGANLAAGKFVVSYDTSTYQYVTDSYVAGDLFNSFINDHNCLNGQVLVAFAGVEPITTEGTLFTLDFWVDSDAKQKGDFYFYGEGCADFDGNPIEVKEASVTVQPTGTPVTGTDVVPVTSVDENGKTYIVGATSGNGAKGRTVMGWVVAVLVVIAIVGVAVLVVWLLLRAKKDQPEEQPVKHQSILDDDAKKMLDFTDDTDQE